MSDLTDNESYPSAERIRLCIGFASGLSEKPKHPNRVTILCGFWSRGITGAFFFENEQGEAVTISGDCYRAM